MRKRSKKERKSQQGSITLFFALVLTLVLSFLFSLLEAARVQGLAAIAQRSLQLRLESIFGGYDVPMWQSYHMLFLDGSFGTGELDASILEGYMMQEDIQEQEGAGFYQMELKDIQISGYMLATDTQGAAFKKQACQAAQEQFGIKIGEAWKEKLGMGEELIEDGEEMEEKWKTAQEAVEEAEEFEESADSERDVGVESVEENTLGQEGISPENPMDIVRLWKNSPILTLVLENPSEISQKAVSMEDNLQKRRKKKGNLTGIPAESMEKLWMIQYLDYCFSCQNGAGKGGSSEHGLDYELEYCIAGKESDQENLEQVVKELLLLREAGNFATILKDSKKQALALEMATAIAGFTGLPPLVQAVQTGILLAWSYMESVLDVRCLLAGGKVPLVKEVSEWKSDVTMGRKILEEQSESQTEDQGLTYREYLQILLLPVKETVLTYRAMDIVERNIRMLPEKENFRMDNLMQAVKAEGTYGANPLFLGFVTGVKGKDGMYHFMADYRFSY